MFAVIVPPSIIMAVDQPERRRVLRDRRGTVIGTIERQTVSGHRIARDGAGRVVGVHDSRADQTRDAAGSIVGQGDFLAPLLIRGRL